MLRLKVSLPTRFRRRKSLEEAILTPLLRNRFLKKPNYPIPAEPSYVINEDLPPSPPRALTSEQLESPKAAGDNEAEKSAEVEIPVAENPAEVAVESEKDVNSEATNVDAGYPKSPEVVTRDPEKEKYAQDIPVATSPSVACGSVPVNIEKIPAEDQGSFSHADKNSPIRPDETLGDYYYRTYSEKDASEIHAPVWNLKKDDTFSDWHVCRDWL
ncbi:hypothetical protein HanRHA438_Chr03g0121751 [Helianthus annuus]|uniref:Uncharacterized protein n=1 Tax=Helianthus annuus TaxID=4232 RepID=A0A9K3JGA8_HELAN|nr:hypothetical protein HanXRQr2_Chr03g0110751 [Helianthus annuus]KAJ0593034.1 hypothetical protein HanHA300_Chr03g0092521 [Helianthus annuus]KAJ0600791.1 hypothetical protein HanIR_Chr03g0121121 [Helianthus annuus]KAJ0768112.1 hypothetical protein HanLR1_Chr03g0097611 [Helianthus annuus]KAJ0773887.1 hypothetical protein HanOQP8_Chr03g0105411 [Helianthus annuus]